MKKNVVIYQADFIKDVALLVESIKKADLDAKVVRSIDELKGALLNDASNLVFVPSDDIDIQMEILMTCAQYKALIMSVTYSYKNGEIELEGAQGPVDADTDMWPIMKKNFIELSSLPQPVYRE